MKLLSCLRIIVLFCSFAAGAAYSFSVSVGNGSAPMVLAQAGTISRGQAASIAQSRYGGKVLSINKRQQGGQVIYRVKLLLDTGRVKIVRINGGARP